MSLSTNRKNRVLRAPRKRDGLRKRAARHDGVGGRSAQRLRRHRRGRGVISLRGVKELQNFAIVDRRHILLGQRFKKALDLIDRHSATRFRMPYTVRRIAEALRTRCR
jgi:hypothetical protein